MSKTISNINDELKTGKTIIVTVAQKQASDHEPGSAHPESAVDAVTTATFQNTLHWIPYNLPRESKDPE
jgi:uncharacterized protein (DUF39 family)